MIPTRNAIIEQLHQSLQRLRGRRIVIEMFTEEARLVEELGLDSLDRLEIRFDIEDRWKIELDDKEAAALATVRDVIDIIQSKLATS
ncbi:MAG: phosphopantetheine-binding protein [Planctomycetaceae bacterium]|nr:phosphopantetheine-binding protein [Planctomycetaceae bacterium]